MSVLVQNCKRLEMEIFAFFVIIFEPIRIQTLYAPQNDRLNLSFVKNEHTGGIKMARNGRKMAIYESVLFRIRVYLDYRARNRPQLLQYFLLVFSRPFSIMLTFYILSKSLLSVYLQQYLLLFIISSCSFGGLLRTTLMSPRNYVG